LQPRNRRQGINRKALQINFGVESSSPSSITGVSIPGVGPFSHPIPQIICP
jgi:hypothetical protein